VTLVAFDAVVVVRGDGAGRRMALEGFHRLPGDTLEVETGWPPAR
jgi:CO/xanthine dehydrogenase FAD-binding subunit